jgi:hypothetical protein
VICPSGNFESTVQQTRPRRQADGEVAVAP